MSDGDTLDEAASIVQQKQIEDGLETLASVIASYLNHLLARGVKSEEAAFLASELQTKIWEKGQA